MHIILRLNSLEQKSVLIISSIISIRLLGIFLILPTFSIHAQMYSGATIALSGVAFGIYALAQSLLQTPFGWLSDKFGRKKILILGLLLFSLGSLACAMAENIYELILARVIQGCGAVGSVAIASLGDLTRPEVRTQAFSITGIVVGISFIFSLIVGPFLASYLGFASLFYILTALGITSTVLTLVFFPEIKKQAPKYAVSLKKILKNSKEIKKLLFSSFVISFVLNLFLFIYPLSFKQTLATIPPMWKIYIITIIPAAAFVYPYIRVAERNNSLDTATKIGTLLLITSFIAYFAAGSKHIWLYITGITFFLGYTIYQAILPAFLTLRTPEGNRGTFSGFYNLSNFFGASLGGMLAGIMYEANHNLPIIVGILLLLLWSILGIPKSPKKKTQTQNY